LEGRPNRSTGRADRPESGPQSYRTWDSFVFDDANAIGHFPMVFVLHGTILPKIAGLNSHFGG